MAPSLSPSPSPAYAPAFRTGQPGPPFAPTLPLGDQTVPPLVVPPGTFRLFPSTSGPATASAFGGVITVGTIFEVTSACWFEGFWWWVCGAGGQSTAAQTFALWQSNGGTGVYIPAATVTSGTLTAGQWNYVPLASPLPLSINTGYMVVTGLSGPFPFTAGQFASGGIYSAGIINGPLAAYSDNTGSFGYVGAAQSAFTTASSDPTTTFPTGGNSGFNAWIDCQVTNIPPAGATYRLWPNLPLPPGSLSVNTPDAFNIGTSYAVATSAVLQKLWFYSGAGATSLPSRCTVWDVINKTVAAGGDNSSPSWLLPGGGAAAAAGGWCYVDYSASSVYLGPGRYYKATVFDANNTWRWVSNPYWAGGGQYTSMDLAQTILTAPNSANAPQALVNTGTSGGQDTWNQTTWAYPDHFSNPENDWVDVEIAAVAGVGAITFAGTGAAQTTVSATGTGAIVFAGAGTAVVTVAGTGTGAIVFAGAGTATVTVAGTGTGAIVFAGSGTATFGTAITGSGAIVFNASGVATVTSTGTGTGNIVFGGAGTATVTVAGTGTGAIGFNGTGSSGALVNGTGSGAIVFAGTGTASAAIQATGTGAIAFAGVGTATAGPPPPFTVGFPSGATIRQGSTTGTVTAQTTPTGSVTVQSSQSGGSL